MKTKAIMVLVLVSALCMLGSSCWGAAASTTFYGYTWFRETGTSDHFNDTDNNTSKASIERTYLRWKLSYEDNIEGNITLDIPMKAGNTANSDWTTLVKNAYVDVKNQLPLDTSIRIGQQPVYFAMIDKWEYPIIYKNLEDNLGLLSSADLGIGLLGVIPGGWGDFQLATYGGNGYAKPTDTDNNAATCASVNLIPIPGLSVRGSIYNSEVASGDSYAKNGVVTGKWYNGLAVNYYVGPLWFMWEGVEGMKPKSDFSDSLKVSGNSKMVGWNINEQWQVLVREDIYDPDVDNKLRGTDNKTNSKTDQMMYGINYQWFADLKLQLDYSNLKYEGGIQDSTVSNARYEESQTVMQAVFSF